MNYFLQAKINKNDKNLSKAFLNFGSSIVTFSVNTDKNQFLLDDTTFFLNFYREFNINLKSTLFTATQYKINNIKKQKNINIQNSQKQNIEI